MSSSTRGQSRASGPTSTQLPPESDHYPRLAGGEDIEAVPDRGELLVIKQAELTSAGQVYGLSEGTEDERGGLTGQAVEPEEDLLEANPTEGFQRVWTR
jgi:hypothetical protein